MGSLTIGFNVLYRLLVGVEMSEPTQGLGVSTILQKTFELINTSLRVHTWTPATTLLSEVHRSGLVHERIQIHLGIAESIVATEILSLMM